MSSISTLLGGTRVRFSPDPQEAPVSLSPRYAGFAVAGEAEAHIRVHLAEYPIGAVRPELPVPQPPSAGQPPPFRASNWEARALENGVRIDFGRHCLPPGCYACTVWIERDGKGGDLYVHQHANAQDDSPYEVPPKMLDELLALQLLAARRGGLFHACGVALEDTRGLLFAGVSGSGKTTTARLWAACSEAHLLGDERIAVRRVEGQFRLFSTPWHRLDQPVLSAQAALRQIFILAHDTTNHARRLSPAEAVALLLARAYLPAWDPAGMEWTLEFLDELCRSVPCFLLGFTPDRRAVEYVQCLSDT